METHKSIQILDGKVSKDGEIVCGTIAKNALQTMTESLVKMEEAGSKPEEMMEKCVWPILYEAARRFETISKDDFDVPKEGFEYVVG